MSNDDKESENEKWLARLRDPIWQFWGALIALLGLAVSLFGIYDVYSRQQAAPHLAIKDFGYYELISTDEPALQELDLYYEGKDVKNATTMYFKLVNDGPIPIRPDDYITPITFRIEPPVEIASAIIRERDPASLDFQITRTNTDTVELSPSLFNPNDFVQVALTLVNRNSDTALDFTIKDMTRVPSLQQIAIDTEETSLIAPAFRYGSFTISFPQLLILASITACVIALTIFAIRRFLSPQYFATWLELKVIFISFMSGMLLFWLWALFTSLQKERTSTYWSFWLPPTIAGGTFVAAYIAYIAWLSVARRRRESIGKTGKSVQTSVAEKD